MIEGNSKAEIKLVETQSELAQIEYELTRLTARVRELRLNNDR